VRGRKYPDLALLSASSCEEVGVLQEGLLCIARAERVESLHGKNGRPGEFKVRARFSVKCSVRFQTYTVLAA
jgi:hypothetical protein